MSQSTPADNNPVGLTDAQPAPHSRTVVASTVAAHVFTDEFDVFRVICECSQDTIHRVVE